MNVKQEVGEIKVGDGVTWVKSSKRGRVLSMAIKEGVVQAIDGDVATVKPVGKGRLVQVRLDGLQPADGRKNQLTQWIEQVFVENRTSTGDGDAGEG